MVSLVQNSLIFSLSALSYGKNICRPTNHIIAAVARLSIIKFKIFLLHIFRSWRSIVMLGGLPPSTIPARTRWVFQDHLLVVCFATLALDCWLVLVWFVVRLLLRFIAVHWEAPCIQRGAGIFFDSHILQIPFSGQPLRVFNKLHGSEALLLLVEPRLKIHSIVGEMRTWLGILISFRGAFKGYSHFSDDWVIFF